MAPSLRGIIIYWKNIGITIYWNICNILMCEIWENIGFRWPEKKKKNCSNWNVCLTGIHYYIAINTTYSHQCSYVLLFGELLRVDYTGTAREPSIHDLKTASFLLIARCMTPWNLFKNSLVVVFLSWWRCSKNWKRICCNNHLGQIFQHDRNLPFQLLKNLFGCLPYCNNTLI